MRNLANRLAPCLGAEIQVFSSNLFTSSGNVRNTARVVAAKYPSQILGWNSSANRFGLSNLRSMTCVMDRFPKMRHMNEAIKAGAFGFSRNFHSSQLYQSEEKDRDAVDPSSPAPDKPDDQDDSETKDPGGVLVERRGRRRSSGSGEVGLIKRDSKWIPSEVLVIPVYR